MIGKRILLCLSLGAVLTACAPQLPKNTPITEARWLNQNWTPDARYWFHHTTQGTSTLPVPYDWFVALERPHLWFYGSPPMLKDPEYLRRFGFIPSPKNFDLDAATLGTFGYSPQDKAAYSVRAFTYDEEKFAGNEHGLPVGFARLKKARDPVMGTALPDQIGFTCAACHTGHLEYNGVSLRIDGAPAVTDLDKFREALGLALAYTNYVPFRFGRFADRVLGEDHTEEREAALKKALDDLVKAGRNLGKLEESVSKGNVEEGFARLDALNRIGNQVFFQDLLVPGGDNRLAIGNLASTNAPVNYPHIWDTSWFLWVQYNASIMQPMVRNAGEALGVRAKVNLVNPENDGANLYRSAVEVGEIFDLEELLAGRYPFEDESKPRFNGLRAPKWPEDLFGPFVDSKKKRGRELYVEHCQECHLTPVNDPSGGFWKSDRWKRVSVGGVDRKYLMLTEKPVEVIGTDRAQAAVMVERRVKVPAYLEIDTHPLYDGTRDDDGTEASFAAALGIVVEKTTEKWYDMHNKSQAERDRMNGYRPNRLQAKMIYKARPLDGIWATAPYLHNGSVPNLYELLSPAAERSETFYLGSRLFDPERVGYQTGRIAGGFKLDTRRAGNSNQGHEFKDGPLDAGVLGPTLSHDERMDLVEYLKSL